MLWEHELKVSVSTASSSSPKLSRVFLQLNRTRRMFSISFRKKLQQKMEKRNLLTMIIKMEIPFAAPSLLQ